MHKHCYGINVNWAKAQGNRFENNETAKDYSAMANTNQLTWALPTIQQKQQRWRERWWQSISNNIAHASPACSVTAMLLSLRVTVSALQDSGQGLPVPDWRLLAHGRQFLGPRASAQRAPRKIIKIPKANLKRQFLRLLTCRCPPLLNLTLICMPAHQFPSTAHKRIYICMHLDTSVCVLISVRMCALISAMWHKLGVDGRNS